LHPIEDAPLRMYFGKSKKKLMIMLKIIKKPDLLEAGLSVY
jgi:hypothetical protein